MENESNISLGGTILLLALFAQKYWEPFRFYTPFYEKDIKENQNKPMETTNYVTQVGVGG